MSYSAKSRKYKSQVCHSDQLRYVVKLHNEGDTGKDAAVLSFDAFDDAINGSVALRLWQVTYCFLRCYLLMSLLRKAFKRLYYPVDIITQCVRWYLAYSLSLRNLEGMMAERSIVGDHSTLHRWVIRLVTLQDKTYRRHKRAVGYRWRMEETDSKVKGQWKYLYRAVDTSGQTIDFLPAAKGV